MPAKGKSRVTSAQRKTIALGRLKGKTAKVIAAETGLSASAVHKQGIDKRTQTLVQRLKAEHTPQLERTYAKSLNAIEADVLSIDPAVSRDARRDLLKFVEAGDPPLARLELNAGDGERECTLEELLVIYRRVTG